MIKGRYGRGTWILWLTLAFSPFDLMLQEERIGFDNQLGALERTLQAKQQDYQELLLLSGG